MKRAYNIETIYKAVHSLDVRADDLADEQYITIINDAYAEMCVVNPAIFSKKMEIDLTPIYKMVPPTQIIDVPEDASAVYDLYLAELHKDHDIYKHGIRVTRDDRVIYRDNRYDGRVVIDLEPLASYPERSDIAVIKYYYIPVAGPDDVMMDAQTWIAFKSALAMCLYNEVHDVERNTQKRAELVRRIKGIITDRPEDANEPGRPGLFHGLEH